MRRDARALGTLLVGFLCAGAAWAAPASIEKPFTFAILEDYDKGDDLHQVEADFRLFEELGITTWRGSFGWDDYEPERGLYDFEWLHQFAALAQRHGLVLRPYLGYTPAWAAKPGGADDQPWNNPPNDLNDWRNFVTRIATAMKAHPNVLSFEMYNEENAPLWWDGTAGEYADILKSGSDAARTTNPNVQVILGGITYPDIQWMESVCVEHGAAPHFDIVPIHAYPETWTPRGVTVENYLAGDDHRFRQAFIPAVESACGIKPIWINEAGYAATPGTVSERDQANGWARAIATFAAEPRIEQLGIYEIRDLPRTEAVIGEPENYHLGLTYADGRKKLAFHTVKRLRGLLGSDRLVIADEAAVIKKRGGINGEFHYHLFARPDGAQVLILWDKYAAPLIEVRLPRPGKRVVEYALDGSATTYRPFDGRVLKNIELTAGEVRIFEITP